MMGFAPNVKSSVTTCTIENLYAAMDAEKTAHICAEIEDALERVKRGAATSTRWSKTAVESWAS